MSEVRRHRRRSPCQGRLLRRVPTGLKDRVRGEDLRRRRGQAGTGRREDGVLREGIVPHPGPSHYVGRVADRRPTSTSNIVGYSPNVVEQKFSEARSTYEAVLDPDDGCRQLAEALRILGT